MKIHLKIGYASICEKRLMINQPSGHLSVSRQNE